MDVELTAGAVDQLNKLPSPIVGRIGELVSRLENWPEVSGVKRLTAGLKGNFRIRTGDYRIIFRVEATQIIIWRIANRKDVYED